MNAALLWKAADLYRSAGGHSRTELFPVLAGLLLLRLVDFEDAENEAICAFEGKGYERELPEQVEWSRIRDLDEQTFWPFVEGKLAPFLEAIRQVEGARLGHAALSDALRFRQVDPTRDGRVARGLIAAVDGLPFDKPRDRRAAGDLLQRFMQGESKQDRQLGEFSTPEGVARLMATIAAPEPEDRLYDPCFGTGIGLGALVAELQRKAGFQSPEDWKRVQQEGVFGVEINPSIHLVGTVRVMLGGISHPGMVLGDALERPVGRGPQEGFDRIVAVPPWGGTIRTRDRRQYEHLPIHTPEADSLFLQHVAMSLRPGGRAVALLPMGFTFRGGHTEKLRQWLVSDYRVLGVVLLPAGLLLPYTAVQTCLVVIERERPAEAIRVIDLTDQKPKKGESNELLSDIPNLLQADLSMIDSFGGPVEIDGYRVDAVSVSDLAANHYVFRVSSESEGMLAEQLEELSNLAPLQPVFDVAEAIEKGIPYDSKTTQDTDGDGVLGLVRVADVEEGRVRPPTKWIREDGLRGRWQRRVLHAGDVVITSSGTIGRAGVVGSEAAGAVASKSVIVVRPSEKAVLPAYLAAILNSPLYQDSLGGRARGAVIPHLTAKSVRAITLPVPNLAVQLRVTQMVADGGGDALSILRSVLAGQSNPLSRFIDTDATVESVIESSVDDLEKARRALHDHVRSLRNLLVHQGGETPWEQRLLTWAQAMGGTALGEVTAQSAAIQFGQVSSADEMVAAALRHIPTDGSIPTRRARAWLESARRLQRALLSEIAEAYTVEVELESSNVGLGRQANLMVTNGGLAPLADVVAKARVAGHEDEGIDFELALIPGATVGPLRVDLPDEPSALQDGKARWDLVVSWAGRQLNGEVMNGSADLVVYGQFTGQDAQLEVLSGDLGQSPYVVGNPVDSAKMFYGRQDVLDHIRLQLAESGVANVILLEGNRRTGKTSILKRLEDPEVLEGWVPIYCSFQKAAGDESKLGVPTDQLFRTIGFAVVKGCLEAGYPIPIPGMPDTAPTDSRERRLLLLRLPKVLNGYFRDSGDSFLALSGLVEAAIEGVSPRRVLLMMDEFDKLQEGIESGVTSPQTPENIRNLYQEHTSMAGVLTGSRRIKRLREEYWSALFGFGLRIGLDPLEPEAARALVTEPVAGRLSFLPDAVDLTVEQTARQPFLIQGLCSSVFQRAHDTGDRVISAAVVRKALDVLVRDNEHFKTLWDFCRSHRRQFVLWKIHELQDGPDAVGIDLLRVHLEEADIAVASDNNTIADDLEYLRELELIAFDKGSGASSYFVAIPMMRTWMNQHVDAESVRSRAHHQSLEEVYG